MLRLLLGVRIVSKLKRKLLSPLMLVSNGFIAGLVLFGVVGTDPAPQRPAPVSDYELPAVYS